MRRAVPNRRGGPRRPPSAAARRPARRRRAAAAAAVVLLALAAPERSLLADLWSLLLAPWRSLTAATESAPAPIAPTSPDCPEGTTECASPSPDEPDPGDERGPSLDPNGLGSGETEAP